MIVADSLYGLGGEVDGEWSHVVLSDTAGGEVRTGAAPVNVGEVSWNISKELLRVLEQGRSVGGVESNFHPVFVQNLGRNLFEFTDKIVDIRLL